MIPVETEMRQWMLLSLAGDGHAYRRLLENCALRLRNYYQRRLTGREADAEDLVQETLIAIHRRRSSYDPARPFTVWLHAIARYKLADHFRSYYRRRTIPLADQAELVEAECDAPELGVAYDLERLMGELPDAQREAIRLTRLQGLTVAETAERTGHSQSNIKVLVHRGMKSMQARTRAMEQ